tara:strand:- start:123701 stop:124225 length:525 start_codon:yes stop_codon:yes gene_type:complete
MKMEKNIKREIGINKHRIVIPLDHLKQDSDSLEWELELKNLEESVGGAGSARCVFVPTKTTLPAPEGRSVKKKSFKAKNVFIKLRCSNFEKKLLKVKAKKCGLTLSEYIRKVAFKEKITERLTDEHIDMYKMLVRYHNSFKSIGNMYKKRNPNLTEKVHQLADEIKIHLNNFKK